MKLFNRFRKVKNQVDETVTLTQLLDMLNIDKNMPKNKLSEATYFACLKILSESIGKLPIKLLVSTKNNGVEKAAGHAIYPLLKYRPNPYMSASFFWGLVEQQRNHHGNAYVYISGYGSNTSLWILPNDSVTVLVDNAALFDKRCLHIVNENMIKYNKMY